MVARALVHAAAGDRDGDGGAVDEAVALVGAAEDVVLQAIVGAARARVAERAGDGDVSKLRAGPRPTFRRSASPSRGWDTLHEKLMARPASLAALRRTHTGGPPRLRLAAPPRCPPNESVVTDCTPWCLPQPAYACYS